MARMLSHVGSVIRGSVGGVTYTANQFHSIIMRAKTGPTNPGTTNQTAIRNAFAGAGQEWNNLTPAERDSWEAYADTLQFEGPLGKYSVPGRQVMVGNLGLVKYINNRVLNSILEVDTAPTGAGFFKPDSIVPASPTSGTGVALSVSQSSGNPAVAFVERSIAFNPARQRFQGPFLSASALAADIPDSVSTLVEFTGLEEGLAYFMQIRLIQKTPTHMVSQKSIVRMAAVTVV